MIQKNLLCRAKGHTAVFTQLVFDIKKYYPGFSKSEHKTLQGALQFLEGFSVETFYQRVFIINILLKTKPDIDTILACLFIPIDGVEFSDEEVLQNSGANAFFLQQEVIRVSTILYQGEKNADVVRRFLLSQIEDVRVLYIRIAKRIGLLQKIFHGDLIVNPRKRKRYIDGALAIGVPILAELGIYSLKTSLEDVCFGLIYPEKLADIKQKVERTKEIREKIISYLEEELSILLSLKKIPFIKISGRNKGFASIAKKIAKKEYATLDEVTDVLAIRIITQTQEDCYSVLSELHSHKDFLESHFQDYIASPKTNGYQSIHTLLVGLLDDDTPVEIQIRSQEMDDHAEMGSASHWSYKGGETILKSRETNNTPENTKTRLQIKSDRFHKIKQKLPAKIYPITPTGEIKELPIGATPVDFAYSIHSDIGDHCSGAVVNEKIFPLSGKLATGDMVGLLTDKNKKPNPAWLDFVVSQSAKQKIRLYLNLHEDEFSVSTHHSKKEEIKNAKNERLKKLEKARNIQRKRTKEPTVQITIGGEQDIPHHFAQCCCPQEKPEIIAYSSSTRDFVIHSQNCRNLKNLEKNRLIEANWSENSNA